jgi:hypothetical protein
MERGYALKENGYLEGAISQFRMAIKRPRFSPAVPVLLMQIAEIYNTMGKFDEGFIMNLKKPKLLKKCFKMKIQLN